MIEHCCPNDGCTTTLVKAKREHFLFCQTCGQSFQASDFPQQGEADVRHLVSPKYPYAHVAIELQSHGFVITFSDKRGRIIYGEKGCIRILSWADVAVIIRASVMTDGVFQIVSNDVLTKHTTLKD